MKLNRQTNPVQRGGVKTESTFTIETSAHAFEILSSGLYTDSVTAIVRELSCNAYDAHVMAGNKDQPFDIHVPTRMEPWFAIRDYGTGLSHDDIIGVYTTYFQSTKSNSDDFIGALGLGSKSPFSYTNDFQVTSYFEGVEYKYAIFLNEAGVPSVALMGEVITDQPNGIEVRLPSEDRRRFLSAIGKYLAYFNVKPNILGIDDDEIDQLYTNVRLPEDSELDEDGKWFITAHRNSYYSSRVGLIYGQVPYPANEDAIIDGVRSLCTQPAIEFYKEYSDRIVFRFEVGDLSITANREELKYDEDTLNMIASRITEFHAKFFAKVKEAVETFADNDSRYKTIRYLMESVFHGEGKFFRSIDFSKINCPAFAELSNHKSRWGNGFSYNVLEAFVTAEAFLYEPLFLETYFSTPAGMDKVRAAKGKSVNCLGVSENVAYYLVDEARNGLAKAKQHYDANGLNKVRYITIKPKNQKECDDVAHATELTRILNELGNPDVIRTSTLEYTPPTRTSTGVSQKQLHTTFSGAPYWAGSNTLDFEAGGIYVYLAGGTRMYRGSKAVYQNDIFKFHQDSSSMYNGLVHIYNDLRGTTYTRENIIGVSAADIKSFDKDDRWTNIADVVDAEIKSKQKALHLELQEATTYRVSYRDIGDDLKSDSFFAIFKEMADLLGVAKHRELFDNMDQNGDLYKMLVKFYGITVKKDSLNNGTDGHQALLEIFADTEYKTFSQYDDRFMIRIDEELRLLEEKYPLIGMLNQYCVDGSSPTSLKNILDYVTMIDKS